ncbi:MAG: rhamnulokinase [Chloroflexi bacterium]|nr:rhamnulokinase [Chloroflexota bacterium]
MGTTAERYLALDLGAESGRAIVGAFDGDLLAIEETHRFPNRPVRLTSGLHWDVLSLLAECRDGIAAGERDGPLASVGVDAWGLDYALLDERGALLGNPYHYRDARTDGILDVALQRVSRATIFEATGVQIIPIDALYQLFAARLGGDPALDLARTFLTIPDLMAYWLSGERACEMTNATTTQCYDPRRGTWAETILRRLDLPTEMFPRVVMPGTILGSLLDPSAGQPRAAGPRVVAPASHDTASAVAGTPLAGPHAAFISAGTWALVGVEVGAPVITDAALALNVANEGGVGGRFCLLRNVTGLWLVQGIRRSLGAGGSAPSYAELTEWASAAPAFAALLDPDAPDFVRPADMAAAIAAYCRRTGQPPPEDAGAQVRAALEGLALGCRRVVEGLEQVAGRAIHTLHVVGGGARNGLLCQIVADVTGRPVLAGPVEATAIGNLLVQMMAAGRFRSIDEGRAVVTRSFPLTTYDPRPMPATDAAYARFLSLAEERGTLG